MPILFNLRRAFDHGKPIGAARTFEIARGSITVAEAREEHSRRTVRTATFTRVDGGPEVPALRDAVLLAWNGTTGSMTGYEDVPSDCSARPQRFAQTWIIEPDSHSELERAELLFSRAVGRLRQVGVRVEMLPGGDMRIDGETWPDGTARPE